MRRVTDLLTFLGIEAAEEPSAASSVPAPSPEVVSISFDFEPLPEQDYLCSRCGKGYRAVFLSRPVRGECLPCFKLTSISRKDP